MTALGVLLYAHTKERLIMGPLEMKSFSTRKVYPLDMHLFLFALLLIYLLIHVDMF